MTMKSYVLRSKISPGITEGRTHFATRTCFLMQLNYANFCSKTNQMQTMSQIYFILE